MDARPLRRKKVLALIDQKFGGSRASFSGAISRSESYVSQLLSVKGAGSRNIGDKAARHIEQELKLPHLFLDQPDTPATVAEPTTKYGALTPDAVEIGRAWMRLSPYMQRLYRETMFRDAAIEARLPWLKPTLERPASPSYDAMERSIDRDYQQHIKQLKLDI